MDYVIASCLSGLIALLFSRLLFVRPLKEKIEEMKEKAEHDLRKFREEKDRLEKECDKSRKLYTFVSFALEGAHIMRQDAEKEVNELREENEALKKELLEQIENQTEKSDAES